MLLSRKYILGHIAVIAFVVSCVLLSNWQFTRLNERKDLNSKIKQRMSEQSVELGAIVSTNADKSNVGDIEYRRVKTTGIYDESAQVLISGRFVDGEPGYNVVTAMKIEGTKNIVFVNRGWLKQALGDAIIDGSTDASSLAPVDGYGAQREVVGLVRKNEGKSLLEKGEKLKKSLAVSPRISTTILTDVLNREESDNVYPFWLQSQYEKIDGTKIDINGGREKTYPIVLANPELTERNHFSYMLQWAAFAIIAIVVWFIVCRNALIKARKK